jgi:hypothetical protein
MSATYEPSDELLTILDPRPGTAAGAVVSVLPFYNPGQPTAFDVAYGGGFLGNFEPAPVTLLPPAAAAAGGGAVVFINAEAAFQACKWWGAAEKFAACDGEAAFKLKCRLERKDKDATYCGFGTNAAAMVAVLQSKFAPGTNLAKRLLETGDAFLLEHNVREGRDRFWSDNKVGDGANWLGATLMVIRDRLQLVGTGTGGWSTFINTARNLETGARLPSGDGAYASAVAAAAAVVGQRFP